jgi:predicted AlkP superfamily phosphohydrolase/phosphomutase
MVERVLILGWDGATWKYIDPLLNRGELPHLNQLLAGGGRATLRSTIPPYTNVTWPSMLTGLRPAKTGIYDGIRRRPGSYDQVPTNLLSYRGTPMWQWVNRYGKRAGFINVPTTYPAHPLDGYMISGFDSPRGASDVVYPSDLLDRWAEKGWPYRILEWETALMEGQNPHRPRGDLGAFVQGWINLTREQGEFIAWLWQSEPVDLLMTLFSGTDSINHRTRDPEAIGAVYRAADEALGTLLKAVDDGTLVCLVSDHGSTPAYWYVSLYRLLTEAEWLCFHPEIAPNFWTRLPGGIAPCLSRLWSWLPRTVRRRLSWPWLRLDPRLACGYENIDWKHTVVYALTPMGPLYLNKKGREPEGIVDEAEVEALRDEVICALQNTRDPMSGEPLFAAALRGEEAFPEAPQDDGTLPDILFELADYRYHVITGYPTDPLVRPIPNAKEYGTHTPDGILVLAGPGIRAGVILPRADIVDVFPTLMAAWGLPIPREVDGRVLQEAFTTPLKEKRVESKRNRISADALTPEEVDEVTERLRALGYL